MGKGQSFPTGYPLRLWIQDLGGAVIFLAAIESGRASAGPPSREYACGEKRPAGLALQASAWLDFITRIK
jgi:hypothetical protein